VRAVELDLKRWLWWFLAATAGVAVADDAVAQWSLVVGDVVRPWLCFLDDGLVVVDPTNGREDMPVLKTVLSPHGARLMPRRSRLEGLSYLHLWSRLVAWGLLSWSE
jgi:hypothetical protein